MQNQSNRQNGGINEKHSVPAAYLDPVALLLVRSKLAKALPVVLAMHRVAAGA
jgi:hypothetical protein